MEGNQTLLPLLKERGWAKFEAENGVPLKNTRLLKLFKIEITTTL